MIVPDGTSYYPRIVEMPADLLGRLDGLAFEFGETYDSYLATDSERETFWCRDRLGVVSFYRWGRRYAQVLGGLLAAPEHRDALLEDFLRFVRANRLNVTFYNIARDNLGPYRRRGLQITKCGEEPVLRLGQVAWQGKDYAWLRRQVNYCQRQGVTLAEIRPDPDDPEYRARIAPELADVSREHIDGTLHGRELRHFVGHFEPLSLRRRRLFAARRQERIEAFVVCNPCLAGRMWAIEIYRHRGDATRGVIPFAVAQTVRLLQREGVEYCSLSLIPTLRCEMALKDDSWIMRGVYVGWWRYFNWVFDVRGIYHFKSRFRPEYREMYAAAFPKVTVRSMVAQGLIWGVIVVNPWRLLRHVARMWRKGAVRKSLAEPNWSRRLLRRLRARPAAEQEAALSAADDGGEEAENPSP